VRLTGGTIAAAMSARLVAGDPARAIDGFSIDTRTLAPGDLYFAIRGTRFDGHAFVTQALAAGASGVVVTETGAPSVVPDGALEFVVDDTTRALQSLARNVRRESGAQVVAITGSAGKTTTKEATAEFLAARYRVYRNRGNLNNHIGLPLSLLELRHEPDVAVVELGMNHAGEIRALVALADPDVRVWTNVGDAHLGYFASVEALAAAKAEILEHAGRPGVLVANADDSRVMQHAVRFAGPVFTFGVSPAADVRADAIDDLGLAGSRLRVHTPVGTAEFTTPLVGAGNAANVLAALATALRFGITLDEVAARAAMLEAPPHRGKVLRLTAGVTVLDDSYNSSPSALAGALVTLARAPGAGRRIAFLGEMLELGSHTEVLHRDSGRRAARAGLERLVTIGGDPARIMAEAAAAAGIPASCVYHVASSEEAAGLVVGLVGPGDLVLVKGSRGIATDRVVDRLVEEFG
jgi:UDP-N-acetylmuramoyl-tripeptide--D-alanyl-D-alanine ligase